MLVLYVIGCNHWLLIALVDGSREKALRSSQGEPGILSLGIFVHLIPEGGREGYIFYSSPNMSN